MSYLGVPFTTRKGMGENPALTTDIAVANAGMVSISANRIQGDQLSDRNRSDIYE